MLDKIELRIPYIAGFQPGFRVLPGEVRYEGVSTPVRRSLHYAGSCDLRPLGMQAILHLNLKRKDWRSNHKLELLGTGSKSLREMSALTPRLGR